MPLMPGLRMKKVNSNIHFRITRANHSKCQDISCDAPVYLQPYEDLGLGFVYKHPSMTVALKVKACIRPFFCLSQLLSVFSTTFCVTRLLYPLLSSLLLLSITISTPNAQ